MSVGVVGGGDAEGVQDELGVAAVAVEIRSDTSAKVGHGCEAECIELRLRPYGLDRELQPVLTARSIHRGREKLWSWNGVAIYCPELRLAIVAVAAAEPRIQAIEIQ